MPKSFLCIKAKYSVKQGSVDERNCSVLDDSASKKIRGMRASGGGYLDKMNSFCRVVIVSSEITVNLLLS